LFPQTLWQAHIIAIHECDALSFGGRDGGIARVSPPSIRLVPQETDALITIHVFADDLNRAVARAIINDDLLEVGEGLRQDALDGFRDILFAVVHGHDDGY